MNLLIDIGNTCIKWLTHHSEKNEFSLSGTFFHHDDSDLQTLLSEHWQKLACPHRILIANVSGSRIAEIINQYIETTWNIKAEYVETQAFSHGIHNAYTDYHTLGIDRWMAIIAAWHKFHHHHKAICVVDCGTTTTIDVISPSGQHTGGIILPGYTAMLDVLIKSTANINIAYQNDEIKPTFGLANTTERGISNGCFFAIVATINQVVTSCSNEYQDEIKSIITGGNAMLFLRQIETTLEYEPNLVLQGLAIVSGDTQ